MCGQKESERRVRDGERRDGEKRGHSRERRGHSTERYDSRRGSVERHRHSKERHDERDASLDSVSTVGSDSTESDGYHHGKAKGDDSQGKKDKKEDDETASWDSTVSLMLNALAHAAS
jgi:hypothetical protein